MGDSCKFTLSMVEIARLWSDARTAELDDVSALPLARPRSKHEVTQCHPNPPSKDGGRIHPKTRVTEGEIVLVP